MKTFYIKCTHLFKTKEAALAAGISPWDMWEVSMDLSVNGATTITPVQVGPLQPLPTCEPPPQEGCEIDPPWRAEPVFGEGRRRARRKK